jgi:hypothetical protein
MARNRGRFQDTLPQSDEEYTQFVDTLLTAVGKGARFQSSPDALGGLSRKRLLVHVDIDNVAVEEEGGDDSLSEDHSGDEMEEDDHSKGYAKRSSGSRRGDDNGQGHGGRNGLVQGRSDRKRKSNIGHWSTLSAEAKRDFNRNETYMVHETALKDHRIRIWCAKETVSNLRLQCIVGRSMPPVCLDCAEPVGNRHS